jgi:cobalt-zinc-cadmium efflux system outer membrane protein
VSKGSAANCLQNGAVCPPWIYNVGLTDTAALEDTLSGKRDLRLKVARNALAAAKMSRVDAERTIAFQVKSAYAQVAQAVLGYQFAKEVADTNVVTLKKFQDRLKAGAITEGDLQRIETQKLEADQALDTAVQTLRQAQVALAFLLGVRGQVPDFEVDPKVLDFSVSPALRDATEQSLLRLAFDHRPDLIALGYQYASALAQVQLTRRQKLPDITLGVNYAFGGFGGFSTNGPVGPQTLTFSLSAPLPVFYQLQGELRQAEAARDSNSLQQAKATAQVVNDVTIGLAAFVATKKLVERMEGPRRPGGGLLQSAKGAFVAIALQYEKGAASLTDYLDALRTYIATKVEYFGDLTNYWTAVYQLEQAVGMDLR